ncbi:MAG TPA: tRNA-uridine aminocarboxypropyltransferase [Opitutaceae bacterium]|nr:tRNA-uridine aminocarboxypropyltransferase [Opitutaceae bacterium]
MPRAVVARPSPRCPACRLPPRWCICAAHRPVAVPLAVDVLMHYCEQHRPSSTGHLVKRLLPDTGLFIGGGGRPLDRGAIVRPGRELWILHPQGELPPADARPETTQILLIDGSWKQASDLLRALAGWGRTVRLPMSGESRFHLRTQQADHQFSTIEALLFLLARFELTTAHDEIRRQFELHVFAGLLARGKQADARRYLAASPAREAFPELIARLDPRRDD